MSLPMNFSSIARMLKRKKPVKFKSPEMLLANKSIKEQASIPRCNLILRTPGRNSRNNCLDAHIASAFFDGGVILIEIDFGAQPAKG